MGEPEGRTKRRALVLAGGGSKGAFEVGVLQRLMGDQQNDYLKNDLSQLRPEYRKVKIRLFQPSEPLPFDPLDFDPANIRAMIDAGYAQSGAFTTV